MERRITLQVRLSEDEKEALVKASERMDMSMSEYIRFMLFHSAISVNIGAGDIEGVISSVSSTADYTVEKMKAKKKTET